MRNDELRVRMLHTVSQALLQEPLHLGELPQSMGWSILIEKNMKAHTKGTKVTQ